MAAEINLASLLWKYRVSFGAIVLGTIGATLVFISLSTPLYRAEAVVAPVEAVSATRAVSRVSSLVGLAGMSLTEEVQKFEIFRYLLHSPELARTLPDAESVLQSVFYKQWDSALHEWKPPGLISRLLGATGPPDYRNLAGHMRERLAISDVGTTGLVRLSFDHEYADVGARILESYISGADQLLRIQEKERKTQESAYLLKTLNDTNIAEIRIALAELVAAREQELVLLNTNQPVAYKLVQPVVLVPRAVYPPKLLFTILGAAFGVAIGVVYVLFRASRAGALK